MIGVNNVPVGAPGLPVAWYNDQIVVNPLSAGAAAFSKPGDSGSLVVTAGSKQPVGLLFAGGPTYHTLVNPIQAVMQELGIVSFV